MKIDTQLVAFSVFGEVLLFVDGGTYNPGDTRLGLSELMLCHWMVQPEGAVQAPVLNSLD